MTQVVTSTVVGVETIQQTEDDSGNLISAYLDGGPQGAPIEGAEISFERWSGANGTWFAEHYDANWDLTSATLYTINKDGQHITATSLNYGPDWAFTGATVDQESDPASPTFGYNNGVISTYDANWNLTKVTEATGGDNGPTGAAAVNYTYDSSGHSTGGSASWTIFGVSGSESWTTGSHQISLSETPNANGAVTPDRLTDVTYDASGQMTGAKILTYGIQGQAFTQTEEDYDASWHLTSWHGQGQGYDQTVSYMV